MSDGWVCPECGLDYDTILPNDAVVALRGYPRRYAEVLPPRDDDEKPDGVVRRRPEPTVWSALEYAGHVADVEDSMAEVMRRMARETGISINPLEDPDEQAAKAKYNEQDRQAVVDHLASACDAAATSIKEFPNDKWDNTATFPWGERDALTMMRNAVHEGYHHLRDVENVLRRVVGS
jgi:hypothetical protein